MKVRPESRWRHLKLIGPLMLFRLGANIRFRVDIQTTKIGPDDPPWTDSPDMKWSERLVLFLNGEPYGTKPVEIEVPSTIGGKGEALDALGAKVMVSPDHTVLLGHIPSYVTIARTSE